MAIPDEILGNIDRLEPLPVTAQRLVSLLGNDDDVPVAQIAETIEYDQAIASNVLRLCNSAYYAGQFPIENLRDAVVRLGMSPLLEMVLGNYLNRLGTAAPLYDLDEQELWLHSVAVSLAVKELVKECPERIPKVAPIAGLVHDIGKLIMVRYCEANVSSILDRCKADDLTFVEAERELFDFDHAEVGAAVARAWNFPESMTYAIENHHQVPTPADSPMLDAVVLANLVAKTIGVGLGAEGMNLKVDSECHRRLGLNFDGFCSVCAHTTFALADLKETYN